MLPSHVDVDGHGADPGLDLPPKKLRCIWSVSAPHASKVAGSTALCLATWGFPEDADGRMSFDVHVYTSSSVHVSAARRAGVSASDQAHAVMDLLQ
jgi:hypothetical protein